MFCFLVFGAFRNGLWTTSIRLGMVLESGEKREGFACGLLLGGVGEIRSPIKKRPEIPLGIGGCYKKFKREWG